MGRLRLRIRARIIAARAGDELSPGGAVALVGNAPRENNFLITDTRVREREQRSFLEMREATETLVRFVKESSIKAAPERVFAFHELPDVLERLTPEWERSRVLQPPGSLEVGARTILETRILGIIPVRWVAEHTAYDPPRMFEDTQIEGPFRRWRHRHIVSPRVWGAALRDEIEFEPPLGLLGQLMTPLLITPRLQRLFDYRHQVTREWCESAARE